METGELQRICFVLHVKKDRLGEYKRRHREVWTELPPYWHSRQRQTGALASELYFLE